jgi:O-antigen/teichoic acid export membrane protein
MTEERLAAVGGDLRRATVRGTVVNAAFLVFGSLLSLLRGFVVAGLVSTDDYGVWGILSVVFGTLMWLKQVGVNDKYIQQDEADQTLAFQKAFTLEALFTACFFVLMLVLLPVAALVYGRDEILAPGLAATMVLPALVLQTPLWVFYRRMEFVKQRTLQLADPIAGFVVTVALAIAGLGYWSLVLGIVAGAWASAIMAWRASPFPLAFRYDRGTLRRYARFSWPLALASASGIVIAQGSILAGEEALGLAGAGAIALANSISVFANRVDDIVTQTIYPAICAIKGRAELQLEIFVKSNRLALMWGMPFGVGVALFAEDLIEHGIGEKWRPALGLIQTIALLAALNQVAFNWHAFYRANDNTRPIAVVNTLLMFVFLGTAIPLTLDDGLDGYALGMAIVTAVGVIARLYYISRLFPGFRAITHMLRAVAPTVPAAGSVLLLRALEDGGRSGGLIAGELALYVGVTAVATLAFERPLVREILAYLRPGPSASAGAAA